MQFKTDRADAIAAAQAEAEAVFAATGFLPPSLSELAFIPSHSRPARPLPALPEDSDPKAAPLFPPQSTVTPQGVIDASDNATAPSDVEQMEHLQLTLQEAFFLSWSLGCLRILDPDTVWRIQICHLPFCTI